MMQALNAQEPFWVETDTPPMGEADFARFRDLVRTHTGITLRNGKEVMLASRLARRLRAHGLNSFAAYYKLLREEHPHSPEISHFINCVTTNKTAFFREPHHFEFLKKQVVRNVLDRVAAGGERRLRIWSAATSSGEEAYSIATSLLSVLSPGLRLEVEASDIDTAVLEIAERGIYPAESLAGIDPRFCRSYFLRGTGDMQGMVCVKPMLQRIVHFRRINLMDPNWPIAGKLDAIFFRNALIYFDRREQERFLRRMMRLLRPEGYLFLGHSEHVPWLYDVVKPLSNTVYQLRPAAAKTTAARSIAPPSILLSQLPQISNQKRIPAEARTVRGAAYPRPRKLDSK